ncbi:MAG TPA: hypothetical protein VNT27_04300 [Propionibacteriaceae bacterium]|nr:hypothetical protein [Propionibacteriaceae bacterium]
MTPEIQERLDRYVAAFNGGDAEAWADDSKQLARLVQLGGEHDLVATAAGLGQPVADVLLGDPVTLLHVGRLRTAVHIGGVDEVNTGVYGGI